jgi:hypothetical protein
LKLRYVAYVIIAYARLGFNIREKFLNYRASKRGTSPSFLISSPSPLLERGTQGVRLININLTFSYKSYTIPLILKGGQNSAELEGTA